jgi:exodeoxyribonuclease V gamma subunit
MPRSWEKTSGMLRVVQSNRFEQLLGELLKAIATPPGSPLISDQIIVPSLALSRRIELEAATRFGICANVEFSFLAKWLWRQIARVVEVRDSSPFAAAVLSWRIFGVFGEQAFVDAHPRLAHYLEGADPVMRYELAMRTAVLLEQYLAYRPDWLAAWLAPESAALACATKAPTLTLAVRGAVGSAPNLEDDFRHQPPAQVDVTSQEALIAQAGTSLPLGGSAPPPAPALRRVSPLHQTHGGHPGDLGWQRDLWRRIAHDLRIGERHPSMAFFAAMNASGANAPALAGLPNAVHVFCVHGMPAIYLEMLRQLARWTDIRLYVLNPCQEYWGDVVDPRQLAKLAAKAGAEHCEVGNRLLASWGRQTRDFIRSLCDSTEGQIEETCFEASGTETVLGQLQDAILNMVDLLPGSLKRSESDRSVEVHVCHSITRELEALHDQLLAMFVAQPSLQASEVVVVTPDLESAAPLIEAVFGTATLERRIPYRITGRPASRLNSTSQALLEALGVVTTRFQASRVFSLLQLPIVARRFGIDAEDLSVIRGWIGDAGIRWGIDAEHRRALGLAALPRHTFDEGLDRLFLGYAMPAGAVDLVNGCLAAGDPEGSRALALGRLHAFVHALEVLQDAITKPLHAKEWLQVLLALLETFTAPQGDELYEQRETRAQIYALYADLSQAELGEILPAAVALNALKRKLDEPPRGSVPTGALTFASMTGLRYLPYRVVCVIGLNDGVFPAPNRPLEFDLMAQQPRRGDRQRRDDDRNVFLDLVLAARERLYLSYTGRSALDNSPMPPSVLLSELMDYLAAAFAQPHATPEVLQAWREKLTVHHPLQPFAPAYFAAGVEDDALFDPRLRSFDKNYCDALTQRLRQPWESSQSADPSAPDAEHKAGWTTLPGPSKALDCAIAAQQGAHAVSTLSPCAGGEGVELEVDEESGEEAGEEVNAGSSEASRARFFVTPLGEPEAGLRDLRVESLVRFLRNPCKSLLRLRLGLELLKGDEALQDAESFRAGRPAMWALAARLLPRLLADEPLDTARSLARAGIEYPAGRLGKLELEQELKSLDRFARQLRPALRVQPLAPSLQTLHFTVNGQPWQLAGSLSNLRPLGLVHYRYDDVRPGDYLEGWVRHLFLNALDLPAQHRHSEWHSRDGVFRLPPLGNAQRHLEALLGLYAEGLRYPLHFFPKSAWAYQQGGQKLSDARKQWQSLQAAPFGESCDPSYRLALRGVSDPLDHDFARCAELVFAPLLQVIVDGRFRRST